MRRSRSGENRVRNDPLAAGAVRRALPMLDDSEDAELDVDQIVPEAGAAIVHHAECRERDGRQDY